MNTLCIPISAIDVIGDTPMYTFDPNDGITGRWYFVDLDFAYDDGYYNIADAIMWSLVFDLEYFGKPYLVEDDMLPYV